MSSTLYAQPRTREFSAAGAVLPGAKLYFFEAGTTTPSAVYQDADLSTGHPHPVLADVGGMFPAIWLDDTKSYDVTLTDADDATVWTVSDYVAGTSELTLVSSQGTEPYANTFVRFREPNGETKGVIGFTASTDNTMSMTSYEDHRLKFRTGTPGNDSTFIERCHMYGSALASWLGIMANTALGGAFVRFTTQDSSVTKGLIGYTSTTDDDIDIDNQISGGHIELKTAGTGRVRVPLASGSASAPMLAVTGDANTGLYSSAADTLNVATGGTNSLQVTAARVTVAGRLTVSDNGNGVAEPAVIVGTHASNGVGLYHQGSGILGVAAAGIDAGSFHPNGTYLFPQRATDPSSGGIDGQVYYNTATSKLKVRAGGSWVNLH